MRLHCFGESGNAYKAALTLTMAGLQWEPVHVDFFGGATRKAAFRALNAMGEVPVLETGDEIITQSAVIQIWASEQTGRFYGTSDAERREVLRWMFFDNHKLSGIAGPLRFNLNFLPEDRRDAGANAYLSMRLHSALKVLDASLDGRDWLALPEPSLADFACCGYLYYPEPFGFDRADYPHIDRWLDRLSALPGWQQPYDMMQRAYPPAGRERKTT